MGLDHPQVLVCCPRDLREEVRAAQVAGRRGPGDGAARELAEGRQRRRQRHDMILSGGNRARILVESGSLGHRARGAERCPAQLNRALGDENGADGDQEITVEV